MWLCFHSNNLSYTLGRDRSIARRQTAMFARKKKIFKSIQSAFRRSKSEVEEVRRIEIRVPELADGTLAWKIMKFMKKNKSSVVGAATT